MWKYTIKRILWMIPVLLGISIVIFTIMYFCPGDPAVAILGNGATPAAIEAKRMDMGLDFIQTSLYLYHRPDLYASSDSDRYTPWNYCSCSSERNCRPYLYGNRTGRCIHPRILACHDAGSVLFRTAWLAAAVRSWRNPVFHTSLHRKCLCRNCIPGKTDPLQYAGGYSF